MNTLCEIRMRPVSGFGFGFRVEGVGVRLRSTSASHGEQRAASASQTALANRVPRMTADLLQFLEAGKMLGLAIVMARNHTMDNERFVPLNSRVLRHQISTTQGPQVHCVEAS